tara:strand:+ start:8890 stop:9099 length:210 start_codon:yes stop_codon:yes gene_type:complete
MTKRRFDKIMEKVKTIEDDFSADGVELTDEMAFNMAESILEDKANKGLKEYIQTKIGASDYVGWLTSEI